MEISKDVLMLFQTHFGINTEVQQEGDSHILVRFKGMSLLSSIAQVEAKSTFRFVVGAGGTMLWRINDKT